MTEIQKLEEHREVLTQKIEEAKRRDLEHRLRRCFTQLGNNESLSVLTIISQLLKRGPTREEFAFDKFTERLENLIQASTASHVTDDSDQD